MTARAWQWQRRREGQAGSSTSKTQTQGPLKREWAGMSDVEQGEAGGRDRVWGERGREVTWDVDGAVANQRGQPMGRKGNQGFVLENGASFANGSPRASCVVQSFFHICRNHHRPLHPILNPYMHHYYLKPESVLTVMHFSLQIHT